MVWYREFFKRKKNKWFLLGTAALTLALIFAVYEDRSSGDLTGEVHFIGPAGCSTANVYSAGANNGRAGSRPDGMIYLSGAVNTIPASGITAHAADCYSAGRARKACYWAEGGERGPPVHEGAIL